WPQWPRSAPASPRSGRLRACTSAESSTAVTSRSPKRTLRCPPPTPPPPDPPPPRKLRGPKTRSGDHAAWRDRSPIPEQPPQPDKGRHRIEYHVGRNPLHIPPISPLRLEPLAERGLLERVDESRHDP